MDRKASRDHEHGRDVRLKLCSRPREVACWPAVLWMPDDDHGGNDGLLRGESREP